jgi:hypothetical protein
MIILTALALAGGAMNPTLVGTWTKDIQASTQLPGEPVPQRVTFVVTIDTPTRIAYHEEDVDAQGKITKSSYEGRYDGKPYKVNGAPDTRSAMRRIDRFSFEETIYSGKADRLAFICTLQQADTNTLVCKGKDNEGHLVEEFHHRVA